jgi:hypothetical protein
MSPRGLLVALLLAAVCAAAVYAADPAPPVAGRASADAVRAAVEQEFATGGYVKTVDQRQALYTRMALMQRLTQGIVGLIQRLGGWIRLPALGDLQGLRALGPILLIALGVLAVLVLGTIVFFILRALRVRREDRLRVEATRGGPGHAEDERDLLSMTARRALVAARKAADEGDLRRAFRFAFYALLLWLRESGHLELDLRRTCREYLGLLPVELPERDLYRRSLDQFERKWYGLQPVSALEFDDLVASVRPLIAGERRER